MSLPATAALWYLPVLVPLCLAAMWTDLTRMKIPNRINDVMLLTFIPLGFIALPWETALWQWLNPAVMLVIGLGLHALRAMGGGDLKFMIAASPYVMRPDLGRMMVLLAVFLLIGFALHRLARMSPLRRMTPDWASWSATGRYPMGLSLGPALIAYLILSATG